MRNLRPRLHPAHLRPEPHLRRLHSSDARETPSEGAMGRRLSDLAESALESSSKRAAEEAQFDEGLRRRLQDRIASASIRAEHPSAFAEVEAPSAARKDARDAAAAKPWSGAETVEDASRRMLGGPKRLPMARPRIPRASRIENAMDQSTAYTALKESGMSAEEKEQFLQLQRERFRPGARDLPATLSGLASLANERIEEAIARGQFKNLPRGKPHEADHNSSSPFIDTTEYLMNKMIKKQDIVPPWIEKQKELSTAAGRFRARLRSDWKRHAARAIASDGGGLAQQVRRAEDFAAAERSQQNTFRDPAWETTERAFHELSIKSLNSLTRTYNLMAPPAAQRPYYGLQRELNACYADVAPLVADEIRERAVSPRTRVERQSLPAGVAAFRWKDVWRDMWS
jgi:hypothetical protein